MTEPRSGEFHAAFCDKVLIHAGPPKAALAEMIRVTRGGGRVGAIEWLPFFAVSSSQPAALDAFNGIFRKAVYELQFDERLSFDFLRRPRAAAPNPIARSVMVAGSGMLVGLLAGGGIGIGPGGPGGPGGGGGPGGPGGAPTGPGGGGGGP